MNKLLLGTAFIGASLLIGGGAHADTNVYRLYNHNTGEHFYTTSGTEKNANVSAGWTYFRCRLDRTNNKFKPSLPCVQSKCYGRRPLLHKKQV